MENDEKIRELIKKYIFNVSYALRNIKKKSEGHKRINEVILLSQCYLNDARYYLEKNMLSASLACVSYSEGLLDALRHLGFLDFKWPHPTERKKVLVGGTFDIIHPGHLYLLRKAKSLGHVIVIVARDTTVERIKGRKPVIPERQRLEVIKSIKYVDEAYLGEKDFDLEKVLEKYKPDIVLLGPDQSKIREKLEEIIKKKDLSIEVLSLSSKFRGYTLTSTSKIIEKILKLFG